MDSTQIMVTVVGLGLIALTLWFFFGKGAAPGGAAGKPERYSCPMHPWITSSDPTAQCSICGMKLVSDDTEK